MLNTRLQRNPRSHEAKFFPSLSTNSWTPLSGSSVSSQQRRISLAKLFSRRKRNPFIFYEQVRRWLPSCAGNCGRFFGTLLPRSLDHGS